MSFLNFKTKWIALNKQHITKPQLCLKEAQLFLGGYNRTYSTALGQAKIYLLWQASAAAQVS